MQCTKGWIAAAAVALVSSALPVAAQTTVTMEAEAMTLSSYAVENGNRIMLTSGALSGTASKTFSGASGTYNMQVYVAEESDGQPTLEVYKGATLLRTYTYPLGSAATSFTIAKRCAELGRHDQARRPAQCRRCGARRQGGSDAGFSQHPDAGSGERGHPDAGQCRPGHDRSRVHGALVVCRRERQPHHAGFGRLERTASKNFGGASGTYNMQVYVQGESDGQPTVEVYKGATLLRTTPIRLATPPSASRLPTLR
jgi:hypothetical protein